MITYDSFLKVYNKKKSQVISKEFIGDLETPISSLLKLSPKEKYSFLLESVEGGEKIGRYSLLGVNPDLIWECKNKNIKIQYIDKKKIIKNNKLSPLKSLKKLLKDSLIPRDKSLPPFPTLVGYVGYPMIKHMEKINLTNPDTINISDSIFIRPKLVAIFDNISNKISLMTPVYYSKDLKPKKAYDKALRIINSAFDKMNKNIIKEKKINSNIKNIKIKKNFNKKEYSNLIKKAKKYINKGDIFQVVTSQRFEIPYDLPAISLYRSLRRLNPSPFLVNLNFNDIGLVASSPEILVRLRDNKITVRPIAGTRPRGKTLAQDKFYERDLLKDKKELSEHLMLLDLGRNDAGKVSKINTVKVTESFIVEKYSHVMHIVSNVVGSYNNKFSKFKSLLAGFPAGTVSGAPKIRAMEIIDELEKSKRKVYAGGIGYFSANGEFDTCIALRTAIAKKDKFYVQAGAGIVADSIPKKEYDETVNKAKALINALK